MVDFERPPRVLVVEDDDAIAQVLQRSLRMEGYEVKLAGDGVTALDVAHGFLPDLVILDLGLPRVDGIEGAKTLRETDDVPILVLTARDALEARVEGLDVGADDYLVQPFERQELLARMRALLGRRPPPRPAPPPPPRLGAAWLCRSRAQPRHARRHARRASRRADAARVRAAGVHDAQ